MNNSLIYGTTLFVGGVLAVNKVFEKILYCPYPSNVKNNWLYGRKVEEEQKESKDEKPSTSAIASRKFLFFHGNVGNAYIQTPDVLMNNLLGDYYIFEYSGYGNNSHLPLDKEENIKRGVEALKIISTKEEPVYVIGQSLGSGVAAEVASLHPELVKGLILLTPYTSVKDLVSSYVPFLGSFIYKHNYNCIDNISKFTALNRNVIIVGAQRDEVIPYKHSLDIANWHNCNLISVNCKHNELYKNIDKWLPQLITSLI